MWQHSALPPPLRPNARRTSYDEDELGRGTLSDYSDYESSEEETHNTNAQHAAASSDGYPYPGASEFDLGAKKSLLDEDDPFADPFGDSHGVDDAPSIQGSGKQRVW